MKYPSSVYMVGIGGIGMSALAQYFLSGGSRVSGSDRSPGPTVEMLEKKGVLVYIGHDAAHVPDDAELLVYSDAVPRESPERARARERGIPEQSYFEALGAIAASKRTVSVAGTHGKTTTTAMLAKILIEAGADPTVIVGSIVAEWGSNFRAGKSDLFLVEACEYRNHFLAFNPELLVITNIEFDHTDFFHSLEEVHVAFKKAAASAKRVVRSDTYLKETVPKLLVPGTFNRENAQAAKAVAKALIPGLDEKVIDTALSAYRGTWRRFEYKGELPGGALLYDDYAHHPTAIRRTIEAARELFPGKKLVVVFHPHLYSRTRDLFEDFAEALALPDKAYVLPVYAAREEPDPSVSNGRLAEAINRKVAGRAGTFETFDETAEFLRTLGPETVAFTMGAGDVYQAGDEALKKL